jgi:hypothetical protein
MHNPRLLGCLWTFGCLLWLNFNEISSGTAAWEMEQSTYPALAERWADWHGAKGGIAHKNGKKC